MADVLLFHHAHGLTSGVAALADTLRAAGHAVTAPDLYEGRVFPDLEAGVAHAQEVGFGTVVERGLAAAEGLPAGVVVVGLSLGALPAQALVETRPGARGAVLVASAIPPGEFGEAWPPAVAVQVHGSEDDPVFVGEGDVEAARRLVEVADDGELFLYPGAAHLPLDPSLPTHDPEVAGLMTERILAFLARVG